MQISDLVLPDGYEAGWAAIPNSTQELALEAPVNHLLLAGGRGWGKTEVQLARFRQNVGLGYGNYWRGVIFDREYKNLDDLVNKSKRLFYGYNDGAVFLASNTDFKWRWPTGEELLFRVAARLDDYWSYHGHEYAFIGWNELTKYADNKLYKKMLSVNRTGFVPELHTPKRMGHNGGPPLDDAPYDTPDGKPLPPIPLEVISTTNPYGVGHNWVKREFIDPVPFGRVQRKQFEVFNPRTKRDEIITRYVMALHGTYRENPYLDPVYIAGLHEETDENVIKAWIRGDWDIVAGGAFDDKWKREIHVLPRFKIPSNWHVDRAFDWGSSHPASVGWFAESNGEEIEIEYPHGTVTRSFPVGTLIQISEWYITKAIGTNEGLKLGAKAIAQGIKKREIELMSQGWIARQPYPGPADNQISDTNNSDNDTVEKAMADEGVRWERSDKTRGSRANGLQLMRDRLEASVNNEGPGLYFMQNCVASISTIPVLPRDDKNMDDIDTKAEDHPYDMVRYRVLKGNNRSAKVIKVSFAR